MGRLLFVALLILSLSCAPRPAFGPSGERRPTATAQTAPVGSPTPVALPSPGSPVAPPMERVPAGPELPPEVIPAPPPADPGWEARLFMVESTIWQRGVRDRRVLAAMLSVPRHEFVPADYRRQAYADHPLPIGFDQTISQPYIVALMTDLLELEPGEKVLEIGTGSGYQAAVLAEITDGVYSVEIIPQLAQAAAERLERLGYPVQVLRADGYLGWPDAAPFDAIIVTAAPDHIPPPLVAQLAPRGVMVIPVGPPGGYQSLWRLRKEGGQVITEFVTGVRFVPLVREPGQGPGG